MRECVALPATWFEELTGFPERSPAEVREKLVVDGEVMRSLVNGRSWRCGRLETPTLGELRRRVGPESNSPDSRPTSGSRALVVREIVADAKALHANPAHAGVLIQVASQFNLLEMVNPSVTPEQGVGIYGNDPTQGPACAVSAGAGTIYRNYFVLQPGAPDVPGERGQTAERQINCLADLGSALKNAVYGDDGGSRLWEMKNGYVLATGEGLRKISRLLTSASEEERDRLRALLRIGIQWNTQVTIADSGHTVNQAYCAAVPVAYSTHSADLWEPFARLILEASYEATLWAALSADRTLSGDGERPRVFLTLLGGGVFGNRREWIIESIERALIVHRYRDIEVGIVSYRSSNPAVRELIGRWS